MRTDGAQVVGVALRPLAAQLHFQQEFVLNAVTERIVLLDEPNHDDPRALSSVAGPALMIQTIAAAARDPKVDIEKMERLWAMHEKLTQRASEQAFNDAMSAAQSEMGPISADATNPQTKSNYATYAKLDGILRPIYTRHGFAISFDEGDGAPESHVRMLAYVSCAGHTRTYKADMPADGKGAKGGDVMTKTHAGGAARSYGMRYLLKMIFNVAVGEFDNDGNGGLTRDEWLAAWLKSIKNARNVGELRSVMQQALQEADSENDQDAKDRFHVAQADKMATTQRPSKQAATPAPSSQTNDRKPVAIDPDDLPY
jgi:hypothetical protein